MRALILAAALALPLAAHAEPKVGDTLACTSKDPAKRLFVTVGLVEPYGEGRVAHVTLRNEALGAPVPVMAHLPVEVGALEAGCPKAAERPRPLSEHFAGGLGQWREAVRTQRAGIFTISADEIDDFVRRSIPPAQRPAQ
jgi:hypothetical protein